MEGKRGILLKRVIISLIAAGVIIAAVPTWIVAKRAYCNKFYENMDNKCNGISELGDYIDYGMLSSDLKKLVDKNDFRFSSDEEMFSFCDKYKNMDYKYEINGSWSDYFPTDKSSLYDKLAREVTIDGETYNIYISFVFRTGTFFRPEIVDLSTNAYISDKQK